MAGLGWLVALAAVLGDDNHGVVWAGVDADGLLVGVTLVLYSVRFLLIWGIAQIESDRFGVL